MKPRKILWFCLFSLFPVFTLWGQEGDTPVNTEKVKALADLGNVYFRGEEFSKALEAYQEAYSLDPVAGFLLNIGLCHFKLENFLEAEKTFEELLAKTQPEDPLRAKAEEHLENVRKEIAKAQPSSQEIEPSNPPKISTTLPIDPIEKTTPERMVPILEDQTPKEKKKIFSQYKVFYLAGLASLGVAATTGTTGFLSIQKGKRLLVEEPEANAQVAERLFRRSKSLALVADVFLGLSLLGGGAGYILQRQSKKSELAVTLTPSGIQILIRH